MCDCIAEFYPKFGYVTVGPESTISLPPADGDGGIPSGYSIRPFGPDNLPRVQRLYDEMTAGSVATALRRHDSYPWTTLMEPAHTGTSPDCQVVTDAGGQITAYVWRGELLQFVRAHSQVRPDELIVAEVVAADVRSARAALALCRQWAAEEGSRRPIGRVTFFAPHEGPVAAAAMRMHATLARRYEPDGGWMARVLSASRLLSALEPELSRCLAAADTCFRGTVRVMTDAGEAALAIDADGVRSVLADAAATDGEALVCRLPQTVLARLALGCFPPEDLLVCLPHPPEGRVMELLQMLFQPIAVAIEENLVAGIGAVKVGAHQDGRLDSALQQAARDLDHQALQDGGADRRGRRTYPLLQPIEPDRGVPGYAGEVDDDIGHLEEAGDAPSTHAAGVRHRGQGDDFSPALLRTGAQLDRHGVAAGHGGDKQHISLANRHVPEHELGETGQTLQVAGAGDGPLVEHQARRHDRLDRHEATGTVEEILGQDAGMGGAEDVQYPALLDRVRDQAGGGTDRPTVPLPGLAQPALHLGEI